nr:MAG TPA: hypothetical protein [Caudoviricetes sp.]DAY35575.1 MAG TPA: hypothetical protein [Caudoviricetes sp.]
MIFFYILLFLFILVFVQYFFKTFYHRFSLMKSSNSRAKKLKL